MYGANVARSERGRGMTARETLGEEVDGSRLGSVSFRVRFLSTGSPRGGVVLKSTKLTARLYPTVVRINAGPTR
ncbi:hypothetical protein ACOSP7_000653 [Xanthoceras sorbifolium]